MFQQNIYLIFANILTLISHILHSLLRGSRVLWRFKIRTQLWGDIGGNLWFYNIWRWGFILSEMNHHDCGFLILFE